MASFAATPAAPYWAVVFSNQRTTDDDEGYARAAARMEELAGEQPGYLGIESVRGADGFGITCSYWASEDDARAWRHVAEHRVVQAAGRQRWYAAYRLRVCRVERDAGFDRRDEDTD